MKNVISETNEPVRSILKSIEDERIKKSASTIIPNFSVTAFHAIVEIDLSGVVTYMNPAAIKLLPALETGLQTDDTTPFFRDITNIIVELQRNDQKSINRQISMNKTDFLQTIRYIADMETIRIVARNLGEDQQPSNTLRGSSLDFQQLFNNIQAAIFVIIPSHDIFCGQIIEVNDTAINMLDYRRFELLQKTMKNLLSDDMPYIPNGDMLSIEQRYFFETNLITKNRQNIPVEINISFPEQHGRSVALVTATDISARKYSQSSLVANEIKYRSLFEESVDAITITSRSGKVLDANPAAYHLFDYSLEEFRKNNMLDMFLDQEERSRCQKELEDKGYLKDHRVKFVKKDGSSIECLVTTNCWYDAEGEIGGYRCILRDLTEYILLTKKLEDSNTMLTKALDGAIQALSTMSEVRDPYTAGHQKRVAELSAQIAVELGLLPNQVKAVHFAGLMHDIGKISIPAELLSKPNALAEIEKIFIQNHPVISFEILKSIQFPWPICETVIQHHERLDGSGYPKHLRGEEITLEARIIAVADVVEAMSSHRPYRPSLGINKALEEIATNSGTLYDSRVVKACLKLFREDHFKFTG